MDKNKIVQVNKKVRDFVLKDQENEDFRLSLHSGRKILLSFHPLAWTSVCATQMKDLEKSHKVFQKLNTLAAGVSVDSVPCKKAWAQSIKIKNTRLLCDFWPHGLLAKALGIFRAENGFSERANIILDEKGKVILVKVYPLKQVPDIDEIINFLKA